MASGLTDHVWTIKELIEKAGGSMKGPSSTSDRIGWAIAIGIFAAFCLLLFWRESAGETWSSDAWLGSTAIVVACSGPFALVMLFIVLAVKRKK